MDCINLLSIGINVDLMNMIMNLAFRVFRFVAVLELTFPFYWDRTWRCISQEPIC